MNKKILSLIMVIASLSGTMFTLCGGSKNVYGVVEATIQLDQKPKLYEDDIWMKWYRECQQIIGITPNAQGEEFFQVAKTVYVDRQDGAKDWRSYVPRGSQRYLISQNLELIHENCTPKQAYLAMKKLSDFKFSYSLPASTFFKGCRPTSRFVQSKEIQLENELRNIVEEKNKKFVVPAWQE